MAGKITVEELTPTVMRRIVHAVDGHRTGEQVYVVVSIEPPYKVPLVTSNQSAAQQEAERSGETVFWTGPYQTVRSLEDKEPRFVIRGHSPVSDWNGPWLTEFHFTPCRRDLRDAQDIEEIVVEWKAKGGASGRKVFTWEGTGEDGGPERMVDALFFGVPAMDKFFFPYVARVQGARTAFELRSQMLEQVQTGEKCSATAVLYDESTRKPVKSSISKDLKHRDST